MAEEKIEIENKEAAVEAAQKKKQKSLNRIFGLLVLIAALFFAMLVVEIVSLF